MDEGKIVLVGNETDLLHAGYSHAIKEQGKRYPSVVHYTHSMILNALNVEDSVILDLLCVSAAEVPTEAKRLLSENMPRGYDMDSLATYLKSSRDSYMMMGLKLRAQQDKVFEKALLDTGDALLIVCDKKDNEDGIGMDEQQFMEWMKREKVDSQTISYWMRNEHLKPPALGENKLGIYLMWTRLNLKDKRRRSMLGKDPVMVDGLSMDNDDNPVKIKADDLVISLQGIFRPLSNYYPLHLDIKGLKYRSVEHYAYEKFFDALKLDDKLLEKIQTTVNPLDVPWVAQRVINRLETPLDPEFLENKLSKLDRWRQSAMKRKFNQYEYLAQLLLSTGNAILIDCCAGDPMWTCGSSEAELQHLLTKKYVDPATIINWMIDKDDKNGKAIAHMKGNKTGLLLMELREKFAHKTHDRIPLVSPLVPPLTTISPHVICFTAESIWHPLYPAEIRAEITPNEEEILPSPAHYVAHQAISFLDFNDEDIEYVLGTQSSLECWERLHETIEFRGRDMEREQSWWMERRQKAIYDGLKLLLEQHPPLLRALLDTGDALLVYCARFSSIESELSIGMRERDLRVWLNTVDLTTENLMERCLLPLAFRPPYLGGNRLGIILMQLRREFILRGVFPHTLPELQITVETMLGSDSPTENMIASEHFDVLDSTNYTSLFINPLFILAKDKPDMELMGIASYRKLAPRLVTVDEEKINEIMVDMDENREKLTESYLYQVDTEDLRAVFMRLCHRLRSKMVEIDHQQQQMSLISAEVNRLQVIRRGLEETRDRHEGRVPAGRDREEKRRDRTPPRRVYNEGEYKIPTRRRSPVERPRRDNERERRRSPMKERERERQSSPMKERERISSPPRKKEKAPSPPPAQKPVKAPRPPDAELSEGEILSSDED